MIYINYKNNLIPGKRSHSIHTNSTPFLSLTLGAFLFFFCLIKKSHPCAIGLILSYLNPIKQYVLADLYEWLEARSGISHSYEYNC
jgi:hypothetical protein